MNEIEIIYEKQKEYGYIKSIDLFRTIYGEECSHYNIKISLVNFPCWDEDEHFDVIFESINNLKIGNIDSLLRVSIQIHSIAEYQLENARYEVRECENELFSFYCQNIKICN